MIVIAHRGNNKEALENSFEAFDLAVACGAQRIELDVQLSLDGQVFVVHDDEVERVAVRSAKISQSLGRDLKSLKLKNGESIPTIDEVIERYLDKIELNIEIKGPNIPLADAVARKLANHPLRDKIIFSSFNYEPLYHLRDQFPQFKRACLTGDHLLHWPNIGILSPNIFLQEVGTNILHPRVDQIDENMMEQARARNWLVYGWVPMIGEEKDRDGLWSTVYGLGIDGLCTNYPRELIAWLKDANEYGRKYGAEQFESRPEI